MSLSFPKRQRSWLLEQTLHTKRRRLLQSPSHPGCGRKTGHTPFPPTSIDWVPAPRSACLPKARQRYPAPTIAVRKATRSLCRSRLSPGSRPGLRPGESRRFHARRRLPPIAHAPSPARLRLSGLGAEPRSGAPGAPGPDKRRRLAGLRFVGTPARARGGALPVSNP